MKDIMWFNSSGKVKINVSIINLIVWLYAIWILVLGTDVREKGHEDRTRTVSGVSMGNQFISGLRNIIMG